MTHRARLAEYYASDVSTTHGGAPHVDVVAVCLCGYVHEVVEECEAYVSTSAIAWKLRDLGILPDIASS